MSTSDAVLNQATDTVNNLADRDVDSTDSDVITLQYTSFPLCMDSLARLRFDMLPTVLGFERC